MKDSLVIRDKTNGLPVKPGELAKFILFGREKLTAMKARYRANNKAGLQKEIISQRLEETQMFAEDLLDAEVRMGQILSELPKAPGKRTDKQPIPSAGNKLKIETYKDLGFNKNQSSQFELMAGHPEIVEGIKSAAKELGVIPTRADCFRQIRREQVKTKLDSVEAREQKAIAGIYDVVVIDPPWPMEKIEREVRPNQVLFDYPVMEEPELAELEIPCAEDCHVWVWTTHKFLPMAFRLLENWALKYVCTFVWHKPGGFQPVGLPQYNCEFVLYARMGTPQFIDTKAFNTCFNAPRGSHSEKPNEFYETVRRVTGGRRIDMFNRRQIEGFDTWGKEA